MELAIAGSIDAPFGNKGSRAAELLNATVAGIRHIDIAAAVHRHAIGAADLAIARAGAAPIRDIVSAAVEFLNAVVA